MEPDYAPYVVSVDGPGIRSGRIGLAALAVLAETVQNALKKAAIANEGRESWRASGGRELEQAVALDLVAISPGSAGLLLAPAESVLDPHFTKLGLAWDAIRTGLPAVIQSQSLADAPQGMDYGVVKALVPLADFCNKYSVDAISFGDRDTRAEERLKVGKSDWERLSSVPPPPKKLARKAILGTLEVLDYHHNRCRVFDRHGNATAFIFPENMADIVDRHSRKWVSAIVEPQQREDLGESQSHYILAELSELSSEEVDELAAPRTAPWPETILQILDIANAREAAAMRRRRTLPDRALED